MLLSCQKHLFSLDPGLHYLNGAYMSPQLRSVEAAGLHSLRAKNNPAKVVPLDFFTQANELRGLFARLVHAATPESVALVPAASYGMAIVAKNLPCQKGQKIVIAEGQFPSNVYPWMALAKEKGLEIQIVPMPIEPENRGRRWNERILAAIDDSTALVSIGHIHWANGTLFDLESISQRVHHHGGLIAVDGTQSVGALPMDVERFGLDALVCAGYKWLMGPYSLGYAYFGAAFANGQPLEENWINRRNSEDFSRLVDYQPDYQPGMLRYDVGERSKFVLMPMAIAALQQLLAWGPANIQDYCRRLLTDVLPQWEAAGFLVENADQRAAHLFGIQLPAGLAAATLQERLRDHNISVSVRGEFVRIAPNVYNDAADLAALTHVLTMGA